MNITPPIERIDILPSTCWSQRDIDHDGLIYHYISAVNINPDDPYNYDAIRKILINGPFSYHDYIDRDGVLYRFVNHKYRAWHAGKSTCKAWKNLNDNFIGVTLAGGNFEPFTDAQYETLAWLTHEYMIIYPNITTDNIRGHGEVSGPDVRKDYKPDPGIYFDWLKLGKNLQLLDFLLGEN